MMTAMLMYYDEYLFVYELNREFAILNSYESKTCVNSV